MERKILLFLVFTILVTGGVFAFDMSVGFGGNFVLHSDIYSNSSQIFGKRDLSKDIEHSMTTAGGLFGFFDATYVEASIGVLFGSMKGEYIDSGDWDGIDSIFVSYLSFGLYGKYPFNLGRFSLFPLLGIQFDLGLLSSVYGAWSGSALLLQVSRVQYMNHHILNIGMIL